LSTPINTKTMTKFFACVLLVFCVFSVSTHANLQGFGGGGGVSSTQNGIFFTPTQTYFFPQIIVNVTGPFITTPGYYGCSLYDNDGIQSAVPAMVWPNAPNMMTCALTEYLRGDTLDFYVFGNMNPTGNSFDWLLAGLGTTTQQLAFWPAGWSYIQASNQYTSFSSNVSVVQPNLSRTIGFTLTPSTGGTGYTFDTTGATWYVCSFQIYPLAAASDDVTHPEVGVVNFTVTSPTTGYCKSPTFTHWPNDLPLPLGEVFVSAFDGSFDSGLCDSITGGADACPLPFTYWQTVAASYSPTTVTCKNSELVNITLFATPGQVFQTRTTLSNDLLSWNFGESSLGLSQNLSQDTFQYVCGNAGGFGNVPTCVNVVDVQVSNTATLAATYSIGMFPITELDPRTFNDGTPNGAGIVSFGALALVLTAAATFVKLRDH